MSDLKKKIDDVFSVSEAWDTMFAEKKDDMLTNAFGVMQKIEGIKKDLEQAKKTKKEVFHSSTDKSMKNSEFITKTEKILDGTK